MFDTKDMFEFAKRYALLYKEQKEMIEHGDFKGTIDEYALALGYSAPASSLFRNRFKELVKLGILDITENDGLDKRSIKYFFKFKSDFEFVNHMLNIPLSSFSCYTEKNSKKHVDRREEYYLKKNKKNKESQIRKNEIIKCYENGESQIAIARKFNVSRQYINQIVKK